MRQTLERWWESLDRNDRSTVLERLSKVCSLDSCMSHVTQGVDCSFRKASRTGRTSALVRMRIHRCIRILAVLAKAIVAEVEVEVLATGVLAVAIMEARLSRPLVVDTGRKNIVAAAAAMEDLPLMVKPLTMAVGLSIPKADMDVIKKPRPLAIRAEGTTLLSSAAMAEEEEEEVVTVNPEAMAAKTTTSLPMDLVATKLSNNLEATGHAIKRRKKALMGLVVSMILLLLRIAMALVVIVLMEVGVRAMGLLVLTEAEAHAMQGMISSSRDKGRRALMPRMQFILLRRRSRSWIWGRGLVSRC